jgi:hypothetical protein
MLMQEPQIESKPKRSIHPGRWVFRATIAMLFIAVGILGVRAYRFNAAVNAVHQHGGYVHGSVHLWFEKPHWISRESGLFFAQNIIVEFPVPPPPDSPVNDHDLQTLIPHLQQFGSLDGLSLERTNIGDEGLSYLVDFDQLARLDISGTEVTDDGLQHLSRLGNLKVLVLSDCRISDQGLRHLQYLKNLEILTLDGTDVTDEGLKHLRSLKNLKDLSLSNTGVTDEGCAELLKAIPDLEILDD